MPDPTHQDRDIRLKIVVVSIVGLILTVALSFVAMKALFNAYEKHMYEKRQTISPLVSERQLPPQPLLQVNEARDLATHRAAEEKLLTEYVVIDEERGTVRIPIERAMELVAERGFDAVKATMLPEDALPPGQVAEEDDHAGE